MDLPLARLALFLPLATALHPCSALQQPALPLEAIADPVIRNEIGQLGPYPEMHRPAGPSTLMELRLRSWSAGHCEFTGEGVRVRIEAQPFERPQWITGDENGGRALEGVPVVGWSPAMSHTRVGRVEVVLDGMVVPVPDEAFIDVFDPRLCEPGPVGPLHFATAARSQDGDRTYVLAQVGQGAGTRLVTWVFENGRYLFRVVDRFRTNG